MKQDVPTRHLTVKGKKKREVEEKSREEGESDRCHSMTMLDLPIALKRQKLLRCQDFFNCICH